MAGAVALLVSCGSSEDSEPAGTGGATSSGGAAGSSGGAAGSSGGAAGSSGAVGSSGGAAGSGGSAGSSGGAAGGSGGAAGSTGGAAGSSGAAGSGGVTFKNTSACPAQAPSGSSCTAALCCYQPDGPVHTCAIGLGGAPSVWTTVSNKKCCGATPPTIGAACDTPSPITCCYGTSGFRCETTWKTASGC